MRKISLIYLGRKGGAVPYSFEMARSLLEKEINLLCVLSSNITNKVEWETLERQNKNISVVFLPTYTSKIGFLKSFLPNSHYSDTVRRIKEYNPDALYLPMISLNARKLVFKLRNYPLVTTIHDFTQHPGMENPITKYIFESIESVSDKFVVLTKKYGVKLSQKYRLPIDRIAHIPHANFTYYNKERKLPEFTIKNNILFFGRISKYKGISVLLKAMDKVVGLLPNLRLKIVGEGPLDEIDKEIISKYSDRIILDNSWIPDEKVWDIFADADFTIIPYIEASQSGVVALSYSCGRTVLATDVGGLREQVIPGGGKIIPPNDEHKLAEVILNMYSTPDNILQMNRRAFEYAKNELNWSVSADKLIDLIYN